MGNILTANDYKRDTPCTEGYADLALLYIQIALACFRSLASPPDVFPEVFAANSNHSSRSRGGKRSFHVRERSERSEQVRHMPPRKRKVMVSRPYFGVFPFPSN